MLYIQSSDSNKKKSLSINNWLGYDMSCFNGKHALEPNLTKTLQAVTSLLQLALLLARSLWPCPYFVYEDYFPSGLWVILPQ